ncbi:hypothetical protein MN116_008785 [Schistosoma mekongi]|uniref:Uncharacterized protein n=1 Tax=Schistosoma mekongi TaxID=38744 RepID=A0AAE1Z5A1_SCHME|nr:hypothetical protein MN116_008785 [Schistosoma mekongi]
MVLYISHFLSRYRQTKVMNEPNDEVDVKTSPYNNVFAPILYVGIFWIIITLSSWLLRSAICWLFYNAKSSQTIKESTKNVIGFDIIPRRLKSINSWIYLDKQLTSNHQLLIILLDSIATIELCACSLECWIIREAFGLWGFLIAIALNCIRSSLFISFDANGSPCDPWYRFLLGQTQPIWMVFTWTLQLLSASIALKLCKYWWSLQMTAYHIARYKLALDMLDPQTLVNHTSDLQVVFTIGFLCEALGIFMDLYLNILFSCILENWNSKYSSGNLQKLPSMTLDEPTNSKVTNPHILTKKQLLTSYIVRLLINLTLIAYGLEWTGMYLNPANAFIQSWHVGNTSSIHHIIVYWFGPFCGIWLYVTLKQITCECITKFIQHDKLTQLKHE